MGPEEACQQNIFAVSTNELSNGCYFGAGGMQLEVFFFFSSADITSDGGLPR